MPNSHNPAFIRLAELLDAGAVRLETTPIEPVDDWRTIGRTFSGRTDEHHRPCAAAAKWLLAEGETLHPDSQPWYNGRRADVATVDLSTVVECGYVDDPARALAAFELGLRFMVVTHPDDDGTIAAFIFTPKGPIPHPKSVADAMRKAMMGRSIPYVPPKSR